MSKVKTSSIDVHEVNRLIADFEKYTTDNRNKCCDLLIPIEVKVHFTKVFNQKILNEIALFQNWYFSTKKTNELDFILCAALSCLEEVSFIRKHGSHYRFMNKDNVGVNHINAKISFENLDFIAAMKHKLNKQIKDVSHKISSNNIEVCLADARFHKLPNGIKADYIVTSPPYLNRNNYIAQSKTEIFFAGLVNSVASYKKLVGNTLRSHVEAKSPNISVEIPKIVSDITHLVSERGESYKGISDMIKGYFEI